jgi:hypothetical protein
VERKEATGEIAVHACESGAEKAGATSEGLALEQLGALRGEGREQNSDRFRLRRERGNGDIEEESKPAPLKAKGAAPPSQNQLLRLHHLPEFGSIQTEEGTWKR